MLSKRKRMPNSLNGVKTMSKKYLTVHGADTPATMDIGAEEIRRWHADPKPEGNGWSDIGYHWVIRRDGRTEKGRPENLMGAHVAGHNRGNIGVCLVGGRPDFNYTQPQLDALRRFIGVFMVENPGAELKGHRDWGDTGKTCPGFDVKAWYYS